MDADRSGRREYALVHRAGFSNQTSPLKIRFRDKSYNFTQWALHARDDVHPAWSAKIVPARFGGHSRSFDLLLGLQMQPWDSNQGDRWLDHVRGSDIEPLFTYRACGQRRGGLPELQLGRRRPDKRQLPEHTSGQPGRWYRDIEKSPGTILAGPAEHILRCVSQSAGALN